MKLSVSTVNFKEDFCSFFCIFYEFCRISLLKSLVFHSTYIYPRLV